MKLKLPEDVEEAFLGAEYIYGLFYNFDSSLDFLDSINRIRSIKSLEKQYKRLVKKYTEIEKFWKDIKSDANETDDSVKEFFTAHDDFLVEFKNYLDKIEKYIKENGGQGQ